MPCRYRGVSRPTPRGGKLRDLAGGVSRLTPEGVSRPTPGGVSRPTPGGSPGSHPGGSPGPHLGGCVSQHALRQTPQWTATAAGGTHPTGMNSCISMFWTFCSKQRMFEC